MAALFTVPPPPSLSSSSSSSLPASAAATPTASQEGGGASQSNEGEDGQENSSGNMNHKSLRHHVSTESEKFCEPSGGAVLEQISPHCLYLDDLHV